jgi:hypothetical protein
VVSKSGSQWREPCDSGNSHRGIFSNPAPANCRRFDDSAYAKVKPKKRSERKTLPQRHGQASRYDCGLLAIWAQMPNAQVKSPSVMLLANPASPTPATRTDTAWQTQQIAMMIQPAM